MHGLCRPGRGDLSGGWATPKKPCNPRFPLNRHGKSALQSSARGRPQGCGVRMASPGYGTSTPSVRAVFDFGTFVWSGAVWSMWSPTVEVTPNQ
jgi:hypothetical protein